MPPKNAHKHLSPTSAGARTPSCGVGGPGAPPELGVVLKSLTFGVSPVAISLLIPRFSSLCPRVPVNKDHLKCLLDLSLDEDGEVDLYGVGVYLKGVYLKWVYLKG